MPGPGNGGETLSEPSFMPVVRFLQWLALAAFAALALASVPANAQSVGSPIPAGSNPRAIAVDPIANKVYIASEFTNAVIALDGATNATTSIAVGTRPQYIAVNPTNHRVYVSNAADASLTVIDGTTNAVIATMTGIGSGPIAIDPITNRIFMVRLSTAATDEVAIVDGDTNTYFAIAIDSFEPDAIAINPVTNRVYVATYGTGDVRVVDGNTNVDFPHPPSVPVWSTPVALAVNPVTNRTYVATQDSRGPFGYIDGNNNYTYFTAPGHAASPKAIAVNPVTNMIYAAFDGEVLVMNGATDAFSFIPSGTPGAGPVAIGVNPSTNKIYVPNADGTLTVIDGATNVVTTLAIPTGATAIGVNPVTNRAYVLAPDSVSPVTGAATDTAQSIALTTRIAPLANDSSGPNPTFTLSASSGFSPVAPAVWRVYYQLDAIGGAWTAASGSGPWTASFTGLSDGTHTLYAFATDTQEGPTVNAGPQSVPLVGSIAAYAFSVAKADATVSIASSANPSTSGRSVTFTAMVTATGTAAAPTGTVAFHDGAGTIDGCSAVALSAGGGASCTTAALAPGSHAIAAAYSGDTNVKPATSATLTQVVNSSTPTAASITSPAPGSTLAGDTVAFQWNDAGASLYQLWIGTSVGGDDIGYFPASGTTGTSVTATGIPTDGRTLYVRLWSSINGAYQFRDFTYKAAGSGGTPVQPASITSPASGTTLAGDRVTFQWNDAGASLYQVWVGTSQGADDIGFFPANGTTGTSATATGLPTDGRKLYVRLYSAIQGAWQFRDFSYTAASGGAPPDPASITSPANGTTLGGSTVTFAWNAATGASLYQVWVGSTPGTYDVGFFPQNGTTGTSVTVSSLPADGRTLYVRLYTAIGGTWYFRDFTYTAAGSGGAPPGPAVMLSPTNGTTLPGSTVTFTWNAATGASLYQVWVGNSPGGYDVGFFPQSGTTATSATTTGLPTDGRTLYVRLYTAIGNTWYFNDYSYRAAGP